MAHRVPMTGADVAWLRMDHPTNLMMIVGVIMLDAPMPVKMLKSLLEERLLIYDRFRQRVAGKKGSPHWILDAHFDIDRHVHVLALPGNGGQEELQALTSDLMSTPLDFSKPLWQMHLVENFDKGSALIVRLHHCIGDGIALIHVLLSMADENFDPAHTRILKRSKTQPESRLGRLLLPVFRAVESTVDVTESVLSESLDLLLKPKHLASRARQGFALGAATTRLLALSPDSETVFRGNLSVSKRVAWSQPLPLATVKSIGQGVDAKINDVLLAAAAGSFRRYLLHHRQPVRDVTIRATIPVNLRPLEHAHHLGNRFGLVFFELPVGLRHASDRLIETKKRMDRIKNSAEAGVVFGLLQAAGNAPKKVQDRLVDLFGTKASAVITNVPGPRQKLHLAGYGLTDLMFWVPRAGDLSIGLSILSYDGHILVGVATDAVLVPDPEALILDFQDEIQGLLSEFGVSR